MNDNERNKYLASIHPKMYEMGGVTRTVTLTRGEVVECYCQDQRGNKYTLTKEQCQTIYPDKIMSDDYWCEWPRIAAHGTKLRANTVYRAQIKKNKKKKIKA